MSTTNGMGRAVVTREMMERFIRSVFPDEADTPWAAKPGSNGTAKGSHSANGSGEYRHRLMVERWLQDRGIAFRTKPQPDSRGRTVYVLKHCPFDSSHGDPDSCVMQSPDGKLSASCFHNSCSGRGWQAFKEIIGRPEGHHYDPPLEKRQQPKKSRKERKPTVLPPAAGPTADKTTQFGGFPLTDLGNAERLHLQHGQDLHHCHPWKRWLVWAKRYWRQDQTGAIYSCAMDTVRTIYAEAANCNDSDLRTALIEHARNSESARAIRSMIDLARAQPRIPILPAAMDTNPWLFNVRNGTLDLRTGKLYDHRREDGITKICRTRYEPTATCPAWERFLAAIFPDDEDEPDTELITFMQRLLGRCLTGDVSEQNLPIFWGGGANGKSTLVNAVLDTIGPDYSMKANADLLMASQADRHPTERADLFGMRLVVASETHQGRNLNEALIKDLTGGERIRARRMREDFWEFDPTHKIFLLTNHKPKITGSDEGIWRRLRLIPFEVCFWDPTDPGKDPSQLPSNLQQDKQLGEKLRAEREGILAWLVRGCLDWQREGLTLPDKVKMGTQKYREEEDVLARWIEESCVTGDDTYRQRSSQLYSAYKAWCEKTGENFLAQKQFGPALEERGFKKKVSDGVWYLGIALRT